VSVEVGKPENELTLPETALTYNPYGTTVFVVKSVPQTPSLLQRCLNQTPPPLQTVDQVFVTTGNTQGDQVQILSGLKEGDTVVGAGQIKLHNGSFININNTVLPTDDANPSPTAENQPVPTPRS
jgi:membrane fusion protein (multidrug efflux system)